MKKRIFYLLGSLALMISSCAPSPQKIADKMMSGEPLSSEDYSQAMDYAEELLKVINDSIENNKGDFKGIMRALRTIDIEHPESNVIVQNLLATDPSTLDEKNREQYEKLLDGIRKMTESMKEEGPIFVANPKLREDYVDPKNEEASANNDSVVTPEPTTRVLTEKDKMPGAKASAAETIDR